MIFVQSVRRSVEFYGRLGFEVGNSFTPPGQAAPTWAWLEASGARLMVTSASLPVDAAQQAVIFCVYCEDVQAFHGALQEQGLQVGEIEYPFYSPRGQFRVADPDGYELTVTHARR